MAYDPLGRRPGICAATRSSSRRRGKHGWREKHAHAGACGLLRPDAARFPLLPTGRATLGVQGHRPTVGTWENTDHVSCFAALTVVTGPLTTPLREQPARSTVQTGQRTQQRWHVALAAPRRDIARASPASPAPEVVLTLDNAPWHRGALRAQG